MPHRWLLVATLVFMQNVFAIEFEIVDLGTLKSEKSEARSINDKGQVCGILSSQGRNRIFLWDSEKGMRALDLPMTAVPIKINNLGQIAGEFLASNGRQGFIWDEKSGFRNIGTLGGYHSSVKGLNDLGQIVGYSEIKLGRGRNEKHAFLWENGRMTDIGELVTKIGLTSADSIAFHINNKSEAIGFAGSRAIIWKKGQVELVDEKFQSCTEEMSLADNGDMFIGGECAFIKKGQETISFPQAARLGNSWKSLDRCFDMNNAGCVVGVATTIQGERHAVLLRPLAPPKPVVEEPKRNELNEILIQYGNNSEGLTALHFAIKKGDKKVVGILLDHGANINAKDGDLLALHRAIVAHRTEIVRLLLERGANFRAVDARLGPEWCAIHYAAQVGNPDIITLLASKGADLNTNALTDAAQGVITPLHIAAQLGHYTAVIALIKNGASINRHSSNPAPDWKYGTPLDWAAHSLKYSNNPRNLELIKYLVEQGASRKYPHYNTIDPKTKVEVKVIACPVINGYLQDVCR